MTIYYRFSFLHPLFFDKFVNNPERFFNAAKADYLPIIHFYSISDKNQTVGQKNNLQLSKETYRCSGIPAFMEKEHGCRIKASPYYIQQISFVNGCYMLVQPSSNAAAPYCLPGQNSKTADLVDPLNLFRIFFCDTDTFYEIALRHVAGLN